MGDGRRRNLHKRRRRKLNKDISNKYFDSSKSSTL
jgi:hypothetical protein